MICPYLSYLSRYEDLVSRPEPVLRELVTWLGQDWSQDMLQHHTLMDGVATSGMETTADQVRCEHVLPQLIPHLETLAHM